MPVTSGFYDSLNGDRKYSATQMSNMFDGLIKDGVFESFSNQFVVSVGSGMTVEVAEGRAWFNHSWLLNDAILPMTLDSAETILDRIDAIVLEFNASAEVRANTIKIVKGTPGTTPAKPAMTKTEFVNQYPLCYIHVKAGVTEIVGSDITNTIGTTECPFVTGILTGITIDDLLAQWRAEWQEFKAYYENDATTWQTAQRSNFVTWEDDQKSDFDAWFKTVHDTLDSNTAGHLINLINAKPDPYHFEVSIPKTGWTGNGPYTQTISVKGLDPAMYPIMDLIQSDDPKTAVLQLDAFACIGRATVITGSITFICYDYQPEADITVQLQAVMVPHV